MSNTPSLYDPDKKNEFFDEDYFERGPETGKGIYVNYSWQPRRSFSEALAIIKVLGLPEDAMVLDVGCAKGYLVKALRMLAIEAYGCDISEYAILQGKAASGNRYLDLATQDFWECYRSKCYKAAFTKDVLEHNTHDDCLTLLNNIMRVTNLFMACVPLGDDGKFRIPSFHRDASHILILDERGWLELFDEAGWHVERRMYHLPGIKDKWVEVHPKGNMVCIMRPLYPKT